MTHYFRRPALALLLLVLLLQGCAAQKTPAQRLYLMNRTVTTALTGLADARDAGLISQDELNQYKQVVLSYQAASKKAGEQVRRATTQPAGDSFAKDAVEQAAAAFEALQPLLAKLGKD